MRPGLPARGKDRRTEEPLAGARWGTLRSWAAASASIALLAGAAFAAEPVGPAVGNNRYRGTISPGGDEDDFTGRFLEGERLTVVVRAGKVPKTALPLRPVLTLVDPDGLVRTAGIVTSRNGTVATLRNFTVDKSGLWAVRVAGAPESSGQYSVAFHVRGLPRTTVLRQPLGGDAPLERTHEIPGFDGAVLDASLVWTQKSRPVALRSLTDPAGADVRAEDGAAAVLGATTRGRRVELKDVVLSKGAGDYALTVGIPSGESTYQLQFTVQVPPRPASRRTALLSADEPAIDAVTAPVLAPEGTVVRIRGRHFSTAKPPLVRIGAAQATNVTVGADGTTIDAVVPPRRDDAVVGVCVVNPDGQAAARDSYLAYVPPPSVFEILDAATAAPVRTCPAGGGRSVRLLGANLEEGLTVSVNGTAASAPLVISAGEIRFAMPAATDGPRTVLVSDRWGRSGASSFTVLYKTPPSFASDPYAPGALRTATPGTVTVSGSNFLATDQVWFAGQQVASPLLSAQRRTIDLPGLAPGNYSLRFVDSIGTVVEGPPFPVKEPPVVTAVTVIGGQAIGASEIPHQGGTTIRVEGSSFAWNDVVTLGGTRATEILLATATRKEFVAPPGTPGLASIVVTDGTGQSASLADVVRYVGLRDATSDRLPLPSAIDDRGAVCGAAADLDMDGLADDLVVASPYGAVRGTRSELTRVLFGDESGKLVDVTAASVPAARSDSMHVDAWDATCLAIGDVDDANGPDVLLGGEASQGGTYRQLRMFRNDGTGAFTLDETSGPDVRYLPTVYGYYYYGYYIYAVYGPSQQAGVPRAIALGDVDGDGDQDAVVGTDATSVRPVYIDPTYVDFTTVPPTVIYPVAVAYNQYVAATRVLVNGIADGGVLRDETSDRLPNAGSTKTGATPQPGFHARDLALADLDGDGALDVVVTWDDPLTVSPYGLSTWTSTGKSKDSARVATRVLLNTASAPGKFTDATDAWMPSAASPERWQASRMALRDLDGDGDADLVLVARKGLDAWTGTETRSRRALRVLRNDGTKFTDVTATAVPPVDAALADDWRGDALVVADADGDGSLDLLVATKTPLQAADGSVARRIRMFRGTGGLSFARADRFVEKPATDSGEADALVLVPDLGGAEERVLLLLGESRPAASPSSARSRAAEWKR